MAVEARIPLARPAASSPADRARVRPRSLLVDDWLLLGGSAAGSFCLVWVLYQNLAAEPSVAGFVVWWFVAFASMYWTSVFRLQGRVLATDRLMSFVIAAGAAAMLVPVFVIMGFVFYKGAGVITPHFFVETNQFCGQLDGPKCGGVAHAIVGTLEQVGIGIVIAVPLAILSAVFLNEVGGPLRRPVRIFVDAMSGLPSIVAGLFIYAVWVIGLGRGFSGFAASAALSLLMLPTITRTSEEVLRLVPDGLREGSLALGGSEWRTVWNVVLPTARSGLITAVVLGIARAVGETAPLILTAFGASVMNANPLAGPQESLPHFVYQYIHYNPGSAPYQRAWAAAAVLTLLVLGLFAIARGLGAAMSIEARQRRAARRDRRLAKREAAAALSQKRAAEGAGPS
ncbi:MAG TPA: phosphate ABC transporter permease PstA [Candidatus Dormibacteraeota bacterium]|jgi:phosphate transport system permease protein